MKILSLLLGLALMAGLGGAALADIAGVEPQPYVPPVATEPAREGLMDGWNDTQPYQQSNTYAANCFGFAYTPSISYILNRVEWYAAGSGGTVTVEFCANNGSGLPTGPVLGSATYVESPGGPVWIGGNLNPPVCLTAGTLYYIRYHVVVGDWCSLASGGTLIPHYWSWDGGGSWEGPSPSFYWLARFYGDEGGSPVVKDTWGSVKNDFR